MEDLKVAEDKGEYDTTWKIIHEISGKDTKPNPKVKKRDGSAPSSEKELLDEWRLYFSALLNNDMDHQSLSYLHQPSRIFQYVKTHQPLTKQEKQFKE